MDSGDDFAKVETVISRETGKSQICSTLQTAISLHSRRILFLSIGLRAFTLASASMSRLNRNAARLMHKMVG